VSAECHYQHKHNTAVTENSYIKEIAGYTLNSRLEQKNQTKPHTIEVANGKISPVWRLTVESWQLTFVPTSNQSHVKRKLGQISKIWPD